MTFPTVAARAQIVWTLLLLAAASLLASSRPAIAAPGEDPLVLNSPTEYLNMPWAAAAPSRGLETVSEMPVAIQAKVARYLAKSMSSNTEGIQTDKDVVTTNNTQGLRRTCTQEIATNTTGKNGTINAAPQIVVLRGDLINACR